MKYVAREHRAIVERYQPYKGPIAFGDFAVHPFYWLREFSNYDKHRIITYPSLIHLRTHVNVAEIFGEKVSIEGFRDTGFGKSLGPGTETARFKVVPNTIQRNMDVAGYLTPGICFPYFGSALNGQDKKHVMPLVSAVDLMSGHVKKVIREFETLSY